MSDKAIRLLRILLAIQARPGITAKELAEKCETTDRTIYRDLRLLDLIAPITNDGYGKGYRFVGNFAMYPLNFTEQEALAFSVLPSVVDADKLPPGFESAYEKVMAAHRKDVRNRADMLENVADIIRMGTPAYREAGGANFLLPVMRAILSGRTIRAVYHTQSRNETTEREIDPYYLVPREQRFYLIGYCHSAGEIRTFRVSRFRHVEITDKLFDKGGFSIEQYMKHTWSIEQGDSLITFKIRFHPEVARYVKEEELFVRPKMTDLPDGGLLFEVTVNHEREFLNWVVQYGPSAEILEPVSYRNWFRERLRQWMKVYEDDSKRRKAEMTSGPSTGTRRF